MTTNLGQKDIPLARADYEDSYVLAFFLRLESRRAKRATDF